MEKNYKTLLDSDVNSKFERLFKHGQRPALETGFKTFENKFKIMTGTTLYVYGPPYSGKSYFTMFIYCLLAVNHGWKFALLSPETGEPHEIFAVLVEMIAGGRFLDDERFGIDESRKQAVADFIEKHFFILEGVDTVDECINEVANLEADLGVKIDCMSIDPWNELLHEFTERQDIYLERVLGKIREDAKRNDRLNVIVTHPQSQQPVEDNGVRYYPLCLPQQISGGQAWYRKGFNMLSVWRPKDGLKDTNGEPYPENSVIIDLQKVKPQNCGEISTHMIYYNKLRKQYYEKLTHEHYYPLKFGNETS